MTDATLPVATRPATAPATRAPTIRLDELSAGFGANTVLHAVEFPCTAGRVTAVIGPSGCGKSTLLRCINRLHEVQPHAWVRGEVTLAYAQHDGPGGTNRQPIYASDADPVALRRRVGMVGQRPTPFVTLSVFENVAAGVRAHWPRLPRTELQARVEEALRRAGLWRDVADRLSGNAMALSGGQQQRLCIARALAVQPEVLLLDEPTASLDPLGTQRIEELLYDLRGSVTVLVVTHNLLQAARISDDTVFLLAGRVIERSASRALFTAPRDPRTEAYLTGRFG